jgi:hypothetical protein
MTFIVSAYAGVSLAYAIIGLASVVPIAFLFKQYFRFLDHVQLTFLYWIMLGTSVVTFGSNLGNAWT